ncbi:hypothetical protein Patl1_02809 [Pistacia atlantica]|uniref:Uncharacterized protein n=1 Tax=Pistacia atlantica TaxID=434234 RepID=A0ACC1CDU4_9ROSI|nr:hypothetical protein Patl1_02809 [Pistacia atlantica]
MKLLCELIELVKGSSESVDVFQDLVLHTEDCNWDPVVFDMLIKAYTKVAKSLVERISQEGFVPDMEIYNKLIESLCESDSVTNAFILKDEMVDRNMKPSLFTYRYLIHCLCRTSRSEEALSLLREMLEFGVQPDAQICRALIQGYCKERDVNKAESLLGFFAKEFQIFDTESYNAIFSIVSEDGDLSKLMGLQHRLLKLGYAPNRRTCKYVIHGLWKGIELEKHKLQVE